MRLADSLRYSKASTAIRAAGIEGLSHFKTGPAKYLALLRAYQQSRDAAGCVRIAQRIRPLRETAAASVLEADLRRRYTAQLKAPALTRSVILKAPGEGGEKGVLLMTFEYNWMRLAAGIEDLDSFTHEYDLVLSTSWSPTDYALLEWIASKTSSRLYVQACNYSEIPKLEGFHPNIRCLQTLPCDWINPDVFRPTERVARDIDLLVVSNWAPFKRHWQLFEALAKLDPGYRIVLVGQQEAGYQIADILALAELFRVPQQLEIYESLPPERVTELQCQSKACAIFSRREGCCVSAVEALFADASLGLMEGAEVGPTAYLNAATGIPLRRAELPEQLRSLMGAGAGRQPRKWATTHLSCGRSAARLNELLQEESRNRDLPWTRDLVTPSWRPHPTLAYCDADTTTIRAACRELNAAFPATFASDFFENSAR